MATSKNTECPKCHCLLYHGDICGNLGGRLYHFDCYEELMYEFLACSDISTFEVDLYLKEKTLLRWGVIENLTYRYFRLRGGDV